MWVYQVFIKRVLLGTLWKCRKETCIRLGHVNTGVCEKSFHVHGTDFWLLGVFATIDTVYDIKGHRCGFILIGPQQNDRLIWPTAVGLSSCRQGRGEWFSSTSTYPEWLRWGTGLPAQENGLNRIEEKVCPLQGVESPVPPPHALSAGSQQYPDVCVLLTAACSYCWTQVSLQREWGTKYFSPISSLLLSAVLQKSKLLLHPQHYVSLCVCVCFAVGIMALLLERLLIFFSF